jgi:CDGSH-type Zn-finger protein
MTKTERIINRIEKSPNGCWVWKGKITPNGYGQMKTDGKTEYVHRIMYEENVSPITDGLCICHKCDNKPCCNPAHLFIGTQKENIADMIRKGRRPTLHGSAHGMHKLREEDVLNIREMLKNGAVGAEVGRQYKVSPVLISKIRLRKIWRHI